MPVTASPRDELAVVIRDDPHSELANTADEQEDERRNGESHGDLPALPLTIDDAGSGARHLEERRTAREHRDEDAGDVRLTPHANAEAGRPDQGRRRS